MNVATNVECAVPTDEAARALMDEDAFRAFYERTARGVWGYLARITGNRQLADDLLQETYYRFYRGGDAFENEAHRRNTLYLIATNLARDTYRRERHVRFLPLAEHEESPNMPSDVGVAARAEGRTDLGRALARLKPEQRELLWLAYGQGSSHSEIADALGLKTSSIKLLLFRARKKLARLLQNGRTS